MFCVKISADDAEFSFDKMTVVGLLFGIFVFMFHGLPYPGAERIAGLRIVQNAQQPLLLCAENGLIGIGDELARDDCYRLFGRDRERHVGNRGGICRFRAVDIAGDAGIGLLQCVGVVLLQPLHAV